MIVYLLAAGGPDARARVDAQQERWGRSPSPDGSAAGSVADVAEQVARWAAAGADTVVLQPTQDEPDPDGFVAFAAEVGRAVTRAG